MPGVVFDAGLAGGGADMAAKGVHALKIGDADAAAAKTAA